MRTHFCAVPDEHLGAAHRRESAGSVGDRKLTAHATINRTIDRVIERVRADASADDIRATNRRLQVMLEETLVKNISLQNVRRTTLFRRNHFSNKRCLCRIWTPWRSSSTRV